jgi:uncharacterized protein YoxC
LFATGRQTHDYFFYRLEASRMKIKRVKENKGLTKVNTLLTKVNTLLTKVNTLLTKVNTLLTKVNTLLTKVNYTVQFIFISETEKQVR